MGKEPRLVEDEIAHRSDVIQRAGKALVAKKFARFGKDAFGLIAETKQRFLATSATALLGKSENFVRSHEVCAGLARIFAEGAIGAVIAAKSGERNKDLFGKSDNRALAARAELRSGGKKLRKRSFERQVEEVVDREMGGHGINRKKEFNTENTEDTEDAEA